MFAYDQTIAFSSRLLIYSKYYYIINKSKICFYILRRILKLFNSFRSRLGDNKGLVVQNRAIARLRHWQLASVPTVQGFVACRCRGHIQYNPLISVSTIPFIVISRVVQSNLRPTLCKIVINIGTSGRCINNGHYIPKP